MIAELKLTGDEILGKEIVDEAIKCLKVTEDDIHKYYEFGRDLGWGKFGVVKSAKSVAFRDSDWPVDTPGYEVAIKIINLKLIPKKLHFLAQEIWSLKKVDHPNIVKILEVFKGSDKIYIVMEKINGTDLLDYLFAIETLNESQAAFIIKQILKAINHLNSLGICHRDIKLENIMINQETMMIKLIDFGFSSFFPKYEYLYTQVGTPYYIAPEVLKGQYNKEWDMWSLGIISFILLTGSPPFKSNNVPEIYKTIIMNEIEFEKKLWSSKSNEALSFVKRCLVYDPNIRMTPIEGLRHEFILQNVKDSVSIDSQTIDKLANYRSPEGLRKEIFLFLVHNINSANKTKWNEIFESLDTKHCGKIRIWDIISKLSSLDYKISPNSKLLKLYQQDKKMSI